MFGLHHRTRLNQTRTDSSWADRSDNPRSDPANTHRESSGAREGSKAPPRSHPACQQWRQPAAFLSAPFLRPRDALPHPAGRKRRPYAAGSGRPFKMAVVVSSHRYFPPASRCTGGRNEKTLQEPPRQRASGWNGGGRSGRRRPPPFPKRRSGSRNEKTLRETSRRRHGAGWPPPSPPMARQGRQLGRKPPPAVVAGIHQSPAALPVQTK